MDSLISGLGPFSVFDWKKVKIRFLGREYELKTLLSRQRNGIPRIPAARGSHPLMSECDILYCPIFFDERAQEIARTVIPRNDHLICRRKADFLHGRTSRRRYFETAKSIEYSIRWMRMTSPRTLSRLVSDADRYRRSPQTVMRVDEILTFDSLGKEFQAVLGFEDN